MLPDHLFHLYVCVCAWEGCQSFLPSLPQRFLPNIIGKYIIYVRTGPDQVEWLYTPCVPKRCCCGTSTGVTPPSLFPSCTTTSGPLALRSFFSSCLPFLTPIILSYYTIIFFWSIIFLSHNILSFSTLPLVRSHPWRLCLSHFLFPSHTFSYSSVFSLFISRCIGD